MVERISDAASASRTVDLSKTLLSLTASIICKIAFGRNHLVEPERRIDVLRTSGEARAVLGSFCFEDHFGWVGSIVDKVTGLSSKLQGVFVELDSFYGVLIQDHLDKEKEEEDPEDFIDVLLRMSEDRSGSVHVSRDHVKAVLMNIFIGATDTSAATLVWAMTALKKNLGVMSKAQREVRSSVGNKGFVDEDDLLGLPYLKAVVKETLRLYPPAPLLVPRETTQRCILSGYEIRPTKTPVYINAQAIGRDGECWESAEEFWPERFLGSNVDFRGQSFELMPFGGGRRVCPGVGLAAVTLELALADLLYSFDWELAEGMEEEDDVDIEAMPGLTMHKKIPLCLRPKIKN
ncbi:cytochrome P450 71A1-like [Rhodamnia argentea]|uniref:Cytochrome P450 71A1-like n=1 Tax=Rhodamnia argentea TaxID=178133 RepID=A0ABM3H288_9MYRT|nr:cytochrome P450 71A1-like [Rhodamnia argentea]